jgi:hypothetical protein
MKRRSLLRNGLLVAFALIMVASMPFAVSADQVDDRDQDELEDDSDECTEPTGSLVECIYNGFAQPSERTGYSEPADILEWEAGWPPDALEAAEELADVGAFDAIEELENVDAVEFLEGYEGVDPSEVLDDQDDSDEEVIEGTILPIWDVSHIDEDDISVCAPSECFDDDESSSGLQPAPFCSPDGDCVNIPEDADQDDSDDDTEKYVYPLVPPEKIVPSDQDESEGTDEEKICHNVVYKEHVEDGVYQSDDNGC